MSRPTCRYSPSTSAALPTPCFSSITIARTLCVARSRSHIALRRAALRAGLNLRRFFLALSFLRSVIFSKINSVRSLSPWGCPGSRLRYCSRGVDSTFHFRVDLPGFHSPVKSGAYSRALLSPSAFRDDAACLPCRRLNKACTVNTIGALLLTDQVTPCLLYTSPSPRDGATSRMPSSA